MDMGNASVFSQKPEAPTAAAGDFGLVSPARLGQVLERVGERVGEPAVNILDVRTAGEYAAEHLPGSRLMPLHEVEEMLKALGSARHAGTSGTAGAGRAGELDEAALGRLGLRAGGETFILCQTGGRARRAAALLSAAGVESCVVVEGGIEACRSAGLGLLKGESRVLPLMRQVQIVIGLVSATGAALAVWRDPIFGLIPLFMGLGLLFAGLTGTCGLALLIAKMPWNRRAPGCGASASSCVAGNAGGPERGAK